MNRKDVKAVGTKIAQLVIEAERRYGPGEGALKRQFVIRQAKKTAPDSVDPSASLGRFLGGALIRIGIEVATEAIRLWEEDNG